MLVALDTTCADLDTTTTCCLRERDPLEIWVLASIATWVEFGCTNAVRITPNHAGSF